MITEEPTPPPTRAEIVEEVLHGRSNRDPYRWLEDDASPAVAVWVAAQNAYTATQLDTRPERTAIAAGLAEALAIGVISPPAEREGRFFYIRREGDENQPRLYVREGRDGPERVVFDPNTAGGTVALDWWYPSRDGSRLAYGTSAHGDEKSTLYVLDVDTGNHLPDTIPHTRYSSVAWDEDSGGFTYTRYPTPGTVPPGEENYHQHLFYHRLGTDWQTDDPDLFGTGRTMTETLEVQLSPNDRWLVLFVHHGWTRNEIHVRDLETAGAFEPLVTGLEAIFDGVVRDDTLYLLTNWEAPHWRVLAIDLRNPARDRWREIIPARDDVILHGMTIAGDRLILHEVRDVVSHVKVYTREGAYQGTVAVPPLGTVDAIAGHWDSEDVFLLYESYTVPATVYRYHLPTGDLTTWAAIESPVDLSDITVEQVRYPSKDGTWIPLFIIGRRDLPRDGSTPTILHGYGGFNISKGPTFYRPILPWIRAGGRFAVANLRGGSEYGEEWHRAGMLGNKQNVFDDFLAAAEYLIGGGYTSPARLGIWGRSNGGLLVGAALTQRPDLFRAVVCQVPLLDMLRYQHYRIARLWVPEYGSADDPAQIEWLWAYSPYHQVTPGTDYPAVLLITGDSDSRVDPLHARKMAALLQASGTRRPVLLRVETEGGHGVGKPLAMLLAEEVDIWTFFAWQLGLPGSG
jgi:prolyl oligopeptidase